MVDLDSWEVLGKKKFKTGRHCRLMRRELHTQDHYRLILMQARSEL